MYPLVHAGKPGFDFINQTMMFKVQSSVCKQGRCDRCVMTQAINESFTVGDKQHNPFH